MIDRDHPLTVTRQAELLAITRPNQVWALDTTYIPMARGLVYLTAVVDVFSRKVLAHRVAITLEACHAKEVIEQALAKYGTPEIVSTDQGSQSLTKAIALETATDRITVNCACPGLTATDILRTQVAARAGRDAIPHDQALRQFLAEKQPSQALLSPSAIARSVAFLCCDSAAHMTGWRFPSTAGGRRDSDFFTAGH